MIVILVSPGRVEKAVLQGSSDLEEQRDLNVWPIVSQHMNALDRDLRKIEEKPKNENP